MSCAREQQWLPWQAVIAGRLTTGSLLNGAMVSRLIWGVTERPTHRSVPAAKSRIWRCGHDSSQTRTVREDAGTDLIVPLQAAVGAGFAVMDGGSIQNPGSIVTATSCARVDTIRLLVALSRNLENSSGICNLYYSYGNTTIGRGIAITDNFSSLSHRPRLGRRCGSWQLVGSGLSACRYHDAYTAERRIVLAMTNEVWQSRVQWKIEV
jgi:hypothetical protein